MSNHTPGPWDYRKCPCGMDGCSQYTISTQGSVGFDLGDARLIALAPEMYDYIASAASNGCANAQRLIAKAEGGNDE